MQIIDKKAERMCQEHADWISSFVNYIYKTAFIHGYKHGRESNIKKKKEREE